jgi:NRAMP (natural resistance-associated macrophage protein)-like metal ion transporter
VPTSDRRAVNQETGEADRHAENIAGHLAHRRSYGAFLKVLGPGLVTGAADDDPSGIATYSQAGAAHGFGLLWAFPLMYPLLLAVQECCSRIGAVTGKGLAENLKENYSRKVLFAAVGLVVAANTLNIGSDLGAMAATARLLVPIPFEALAVGFAVVITALAILVPYRSYARILKWLAVALFAYPITAFVVGQQWGHVFTATFNYRPKLDFGLAYILVGMIGTTISPYLFFWDTSQVVEEEIEQNNMDQIGEEPIPTRAFLRVLRIDNLVGMTLASLTAWFIVIVCGSVLFSRGITQINTAADAAKALEPLVSNFPHAGLIAKLLFSAGIIGSGLLAVPTLAGSASYAISEMMGWKEGLYRKFRQAAGFYTVIAVAMLVGLSIDFLGINPIKALVFTAVFNGVAAVPLLFMIGRIGNSRAVMGAYKNRWLSNLGVRVAFAVMALAVLILFYALASGKA